MIIRRHFITTILGCLAFLDQLVAQTVHPADYGRVVLHLKAEELALENAAPVTTWGPLSSAGTAAPAFTAADARFNGKPAVKFDGTTDYMTWSEADLNARTLIAAVVLDTGATTNASLISNGGNDLHIRRNASALAYRSPGKGLEVFDFVGGTPAGTLSVNAVASGNFTAGTPHLLVATAGHAKNYSAFWIGNPGTTAGGFWRGSVAELIVYDGVLSADGLASVGWYLQNKYALPTTFPPPKPFVRAFTAAQGGLTSSGGLLSPSGQSVVLSWNVENAEAVTIDHDLLASSNQPTGSVNVSAQSTTTYTLTATNAQGSVTASVVIHVGVVPVPVRINELMAENEDTLKDEDGDASDWIELINPNPFALDLAGLRLRDGTDQWDFPVGSRIEANGYRVVFASAKNRTDPAQPLHTNFALNKAGEYLALVRISDGVALSEFAPAFPLMSEDRSYGWWGEPPQLGFFGAPLSDPTPGAPNAASGAAGFLDDTDALTFSVGRGFFADPVREVVAARTPGARLIYTTNGSTPSLTNGTVVPPPDAASPPVLTIAIFPGSVPAEETGPAVASIGGTTTLRVAAFKDGFAPTRVETHTYIFTSVVARQSVADARTRGWPSSSVNGQVFKYGMNAAAVNTYTDAAVIASLQALPVVSLVTDQAHLTAPSTGIYVNADQHGPAWERPVSVEMFFPPGWTEAWGRPIPFHINAGLRIRGGYSRNDNFQKHGLRMYFSGKYEGKLRTRVYGPEGANEFGKLELGIGSNYGWFRESSYGSGRFNTMCRDPFSRDTQGALGQPNARTRYVHVYINGVYWGVHYVEERAEADYAASYFGGRSDDYDVVKCGNHVGGFQTEVTDGDLLAWRTLWQKVRAIGTADASNAKYFALEGRDANGVRDPVMPVWLDIDNLIDEMLAIFFTGDGDAVLSNFLGHNQPNNWWGSRRRNGESGFRFFIRDAEHTLGAPSWVNDQTGPWTGSNQNSFNFSNPQWMHQDLMKNAEYKLRFADRAHRHFFNGGALTRDETIARFRRRAAQVEKAMTAESVRWGNTQSISGLPAGHPPYYNVADWQSAITSVVNTTLPNRGTTVLNQLRAAKNGLYPQTVAPSFVDAAAGTPRHGGSVDPGFRLAMTAPAGTIHYTLDGSDPRLLGGAVAPAAMTYADPFTLTGTVRVRSRVFTGTNWSALNEATFTVGGEPASARTLVVSEIHYHPADPGQTEFLEFLNIGSATIDLTGVRVEGAVSFAFPAQTRLAPGGRLVVAGSLVDFAARYPNAPRPALGPFSGALNNAGEEISVISDAQGVIRRFSYDDASPWPVEADGTGPSLLLVHPESNPDHSDPGNWVASTAAGGTPGAHEGGTGGFTGPNPDADNDSDGFSAFLEHAVGTSDSNPADGPDRVTAAILPFSPDGVAGEFLSLTFAKPAQSTLAYTVETTTGLTLWRSGPAHVVLASESPGPNGTTLQTWRSTQPISPTAPAYIRLRVWIP
ncbi:MAG: lamin tail domain-containing protein [Verrucomicrobiales bacterium]